ncbi:MAG: ArsR family transcriptional regulator [Gemmatimonadota bacterium]|nr:ArsR family transcriptional regulator [Gemmatimonadota bacterium]
MGFWQRHFADTTRGKIVGLLRRGRKSVEELAAALGLTDNAVRAQLTALEHEGIVGAAGVRRSGTVGKPATEYEIAPGAEVVFSTAYAPVLSALMAELGDRMTPRSLETLMRDVGRRLAPPVAADASHADRVRAAAALLRELGGDIEQSRSGEEVVLRGHGCPLSQAVRARPEMCNAVEQLLSEVAGTPVHERCDRAGEPSCRFVIQARRSGRRAS